MQRFIILFILYNSLSASINEPISICMLRISFKDDSLNSTTGTGSFLMENQGIDCGKYTIDSAPHDYDYFLSQLKAVNAYYENVSNGNFGIELNNSSIYPSTPLNDYKISNRMNYYNPYEDISLQEKRLTELFRDALEQAYFEDQIDYSNYDLIVVVHAGIGQDFSLPFLDPTPEDIPSTFIDNNMIVEHLNVPSILIGDSFVSKGIIIPETQNHLLFEISETMFSDANNPCEYQYALTGTFALMIGFAIGLPPLWNIESGESGVGIFGLMDQGSNNGRGITPAPPTAWTRIYAGWENPIIGEFGKQYFLPIENDFSIIKVPIREQEYFLIESRSNWVRPKVSIDSIRFYIGSQSASNEYPGYTEILQDSSKLQKDTNGVIIKVPNYNIGLPESGLLIWHIDENIINSGIETYTINSSTSNKGVDLEEADGAQDIGFISTDIFNDPSSGWFGDMWFKGNSQYLYANPGMEGFNPVFSSDTYPSTKSNDGDDSFIKIENISKSQDTMTFSIKNTYLIDKYPDSTFHYISSFDINNDGLKDFIGGKDSIYIQTSDSSSQRSYFHKIKSEDIEVAFTKYDDRTVIDIVEYFLDSLRHYKYDYVINEKSITKFFDVTSDSLFYLISDENHELLHLKSFDQWMSYSKRVFSSPCNFSIGLNQKGISVDCFDGSVNKYSEKVFTYIAGIDLNLDAQGDLLALDSNGILYGLNHDLILLPSFPLDIRLSSPVLSQNIMGDNFPEIIAKSLDQKTLYVFDSQGNVKLAIATNLDDELISIEPHNDLHSIFTQSSIYSFNTFQNPNGNQWIMEHGNIAKTRKLDLNYNFISDGTLLKNAYCYPNPIRENIGTIRVEMVGSSSVDITIFDLAGYFIDSFKSDINTAGHQLKEWSWVTKDINPGVYFAHITVSNDKNIEHKIIKIAVIQ